MVYIPIVLHLEEFRISHLGGSNWRWILPFVRTIRSDRYVGHRSAKVGTVVIVKARYNIERKLRMIHDGRKPRMRECCSDNMFDGANDLNAI